MKHSKQHYRDIKSNGYEWFGFIDGLHHFTKEHGGFIDGKFIPKTYSELICSEECLENGNFEFMAKHGFTYGKELVSKLTAKYRKQEKKRLEAIV
jgi:hypothetical protein